jgi:hypothetical protein
MANTNNGFDPKTNPKAQPQTAQASGQTSSEASSTKTPLGGEDAAYRAQVAAELAQIRTQVQESLTAKAQAIQKIGNEYQAAAQPLVNDSSVMLADILLGGSFFGQIARNVGELVAAHPTGPKTGIVAPSLKQVSFAPLQQGTQSAYLTSSDEPSNTASQG